MSDPEAHFLFLWQAAGGPVPITQELQFHPTRKWRADFAIQSAGVLIEIEGGAFSRGRHTRGTGFANDAEKYLEATLLGWTLIRLIPQQLNLTTIERIISWIAERQKSPHATFPVSSNPMAGKDGSSHTSNDAGKKSTIHSSTSNRRNRRPNAGRAFICSMNS